MWPVTCSQCPQQCALQILDSKLEFHGWQSVAGQAHSQAKPKAPGAFQKSEFLSSVYSLSCSKSGPSSLVLASMTRIQPSSVFEYFKGLHRKEQPLGTSRQEGPLAGALLSPNCFSELLLNHPEACLAQSSWEAHTARWGRVSFADLARACLPS